MKSYIRIHPNDLVAVALAPLAAGTVVRIGDEELVLREDIPQGHKFALKDIAAGQPVIKYNASIGIAKEAIPAGSWVHTHNLQTGLGEVLEYTYSPGALPLAPEDECFFRGFRRKDGSVGVRNEIWIIPTVGCVNRIAAAIEKKAQKFVHGAVEAVKAFSHPYGCSQMGEDQENTRIILSDLIRHPNAAGVLVIGLGCENSNVSVLKEYLGEYDPDRVKFLVCQETADEAGEALKLIAELAESAGEYRREPVSSSELIVGLKCGGSDGLSGITANPTAGRFSDLLIARGGTTILTEVPEMFGAETLLMNRCVNEKVFEDTVKLVNGFKDYFMRHGQRIYENPSPGNKKGGLSTLEDKSLGCTQKSGSAPVSGVLAYGEQVTRKGLNLLSAPGNDLVASTALAAAGAHMVLFTTGRGTPIACPVPTMKISSNSRLAENKAGWIDFDCGTLVTEDADPEELAQKLFDLVIETASGKRVRSEEADCYDMAIFKEGVTL